MIEIPDELLNYHELTMLYIVDSKLFVSIAPASGMVAPSFKVLGVAFLRSQNSSLHLITFSLIPQLVPANHPSQHGPLILISSLSMYHISLSYICRLFRRK
jgi:hypothetical protein